MENKINLLLSSCIFFIRQITIKYLLVLAIFLFSFLAKSQESIPIPTPAQLRWQDAELTVVFHYDLHVLDTTAYNQGANRITPVADYNIFNPEQLDTDQWVRSAKNMGAKIAILTATHETGFALYQSDVNPYCLKAVKWKEGKGDIVKDFVESCRKYDILPGIYIGIRWNSFYGVYDFKVSGDDDFAKNRQDHYNKMCEGMVEELCSRYGDLAIVWFDGGAHGPKQGGPDVQGIFEKYQPNGLFYHNLDRADMRWGGSESGTVPYPCWGTMPTASWFNNKGIDNNFFILKHGDPDGKYYCPAMSDAPLRGYNGLHEWFWEPNQEKAVYPLDDLVDMYYNSVGHNTSLILGITPDNRGLVPEIDSIRMQELGEVIKKNFADPIAETSGNGTEFNLSIPRNQTINQLVIMEDITKGERIREFSLEALTKRGWQTIFEGTCVGHKFIHRVDDLKAKEVRLRIKKSMGETRIVDFSVYKASK